MQLQRAALHRPALLPAPAHTHALTHKHDGSHVRNSREFGVVLWPRRQQCQREGAALGVADVGGRLGASLLESCVYVWTVWCVLSLQLCVVSTRRECSIGVADVGSGLGTSLLEHCVCVGRGCKVFQ